SAETAIQGPIERPLFQPKRERDVGNREPLGISKPHQEAVLRWQQVERLGEGSPCPPRGFTLFAVEQDCVRLAVRRRSILEPFWSVGPAGGPFGELVQ